MERRHTVKELHAPLLLAVSILLLCMVALPTYRFHGRDFRQDDINTTHAAQILTLPQVAQWMAVNAVHPAGWRLAATSYLKLMGDAGTTEPVARYFSTLTTLLALALLFRLAADLFDWETGLYAVFILGTTPFTLFYMHELRPYPMLILITCGLLLTFLRWLYQPTFKYALLYVIFGVAGLQTHYFAAYVIAAQVVTLVLLVRWNRGLYVRAFGLFAAIGLSGLAWVLPLANRWLMGTNKSYARASQLSTLRALNRLMQIDPAALGQFLLLFGLLVPVGVWMNRRSRTQEALRFSPEWRKLYLLIVPGSALAAAFAVNFVARTITPRNLIEIMPPLTILIAFALRKLPARARLVAVLLIAYPALTRFHPFETNAPYQEVTQFMAADYQPGDRIVTHITDPASITQSFMYYLLDRLPQPVNKYDMFHIGGAGFGGESVDSVINWVFNTQPETLDQFADFLAPASHLWYIEYQYRPTELGEPFRQMLNAQFGTARFKTFPAERGGAYAITEYRRVPDSVQDIAHFGPDSGAAISLQAWTLRDSVTVQPCQTITLESWWTVLDPPDTDYGIGLVLADANGQGAARANGLPSGLRTKKWLPGEYQIDTRTLTIPCDIAPGAYSLLIGFYDYATTEPAPVTLPDGTPTGSPLIYLTTLNVQ